MIYGWQLAGVYIARHKMSIISHPNTPSIIRWLDYYRLAIWCDKTDFFRCRIFIFSPLIFQPNLNSLLFPINRLRHHFQINQMGMIRSHQWSIISRCSQQVVWRSVFSQWVSIQGGRFKHHVFPIFQRNRRGRSSSSFFVCPGDKPPTKV